jgi:hypothetical protein
VTGENQFNRKTLVFCQLHWLPVRQLIDFKVAALEHRSLSGDAPIYLNDDCHLIAYVTERHLLTIETR